MERKSNDGPYPTDNYVITTTIGGLLWKNSKL